MNAPFVARPSLSSARLGPVRSEPPRSEPQRLDPERIHGTGRRVAAIVIAFNGAAALAALVLHLGNLVALGYPVGAVLVSIVLLRRTSTSEFLEFVLWLWLLAPAIRRIVDLGVGYTPVSYVLLAAPAATCLGLVPALRAPRAVHADAIRAIAVGLTATVFAFIVGVLLNGASASIGALIEWLPPVSFGAYVAGAGPSTPVLRAAVKRFALWASMVLGGYGVLQFVLLPEWDAFWMRNAEINSVGQPKPFEVRVFGTLNSPNPYAVVVGALLLLVLAGVKHRRGRILAIVLGSLGFALSLVRSAWLGALLAILALIRAGRGRALASVVAALAVPVIVVLAVGGPIKDAIDSRVSSSVQSGSHDESFTDRVQFYSKTIPQIATDIAGKGDGSLGVSTKLSNADNQLGANGDFDSGLLAVLYIHGLGVGLVLLFVLSQATLRAWRRSRQGDDFDIACGAALLGILAQLLLGNPLVSAMGVVFWLLLGLLARVEDDQPAMD